MVNTVAGVSHHKQSHLIYMYIYNCNAQQPYTTTRNLVTHYCSHSGIHYKSRIGTFLDCKFRFLAIKIYVQDVECQSATWLIESILITRKLGLFIIHLRVWHWDVTVKQCRHCHLNLSGFHENTQNVEWHMSLKLPLLRRIIREWQRHFVYNANTKHYSNSTTMF